MKKLQFGKIVKIFSLILGVASIVLALFLFKIETLLEGNNLKLKSSLSFTEQRNSYFASKEKGVYLNTSFNQSLLQILNYFQNNQISPGTKDDRKVRYQDLFSLLPETWTSLSNKVEGKGANEELASFLFHFILKTEPDYNLAAFLPIFFNTLNDFRIKKESNELVNLVQIDQSLRDDVVEGKKYEENGKQILAEILLDLEILQKNKEGEIVPNFSLKISPEGAKYSEPFQIEQKLEEDPGTLYTVNAITIDFNLKTIPLKMEIVFEGEIDYYSVLEGAAKLVKLMFLLQLSEADLNKPIQQLNQEFLKWITNQTDQKMSKNEKIATNLISSFLLENLLKLKVEVEIVREGRREYKEYSINSFVNLLEILTESEFEESKSYWQLTTKKCKDDAKQLVDSLWGIRDFDNEFGGFCKTPESEKDNGQEGDLIEFDIFGFIKALEEYSFGVVKVKKILEEKLTELFDNSFKDSFNLQKFLESLIAFKNNLYQSLEEITNFDLEEESKPNPGIRLINNILKENNPFLKNVVVEKIKNFYQKNQKTIQDILDGKNIDVFAIDQKWSSIFVVQDFFIQRKGDRKFLVFLVEDASLEVKKHMFALTKSIDKGEDFYQVVYCAPNHYENQFSNFLDSQFSN